MGSCELSLRKFLLIQEKKRACMQDKTSEAATSEVLFVCLLMISKIDGFISDTVSG